MEATINTSVAPEKAVQTETLLARVYDEHRLELNHRIPPNEDVSFPQEIQTYNIYTPSELDQPNQLDKLPFLLKLLDSPALKKVLEENPTQQSGLTESMSDLRKATLTRRQFLGGIALGSAMLAAHQHPEILGKIAKIAAAATHKASVRQALAELFPGHAFATEFGDLKGLHETAFYSEDSLEVDKDAVPVDRVTENGREILAVDKHRLHWQADGKAVEDEFLAYTNPDQGFFSVKGHSACTWRLDGQEVASLQVPLVLDLALKRTKHRDQYTIHSYNRQSVEIPGFDSLDSTTPPLDPRGLSDLLSPMHTAGSFLTLHAGETPVAAVNPTWCSQSCMTFANASTTERPFALREFLPFASRQAFWNPDLMPKFKSLSNQEKVFVLQMVKSMAVERWSDVKKSSWEDPMFHRIVRYNPDGSVTVQKDTDLVAELDQMAAADNLDADKSTTSPVCDEYFKNYGFVKPVFCLEATRVVGTVPDRESDPTNVALNMAVVTKDRVTNKSHVVGLLTANQRRRFSMNQLHKIGLEWIAAQGIEPDDTFFVGLDEHGGGEVSSIKNNNPQTQP